MYYAVTIATLVTMALALIRALLGPTVYDRVLSVNMFGTKVVLLLSVIAFLGGRHFRPRPIDKTIAEMAAIDNNRLFIVDNSLAQDTQCCVYPNLTHNAIQQGTVDIVLDEIELPQAIASLAAILLSFETASGK